VLTGLRRKRKTTLDVTTEQQVHVFSLWPKIQEGCCTDHG